MAKVYNEVQKALTSGKDKTEVQKRYEAKYGVLKEVNWGRNDDTKI